MTSHPYISRPWVPAELEEAIKARAAQYRELSTDALEGELRRLVARHEQYMDRECLSLMPAQTS